MGGSLAGLHRGSPDCVRKIFGVLPSLPFHRARLPLVAYTGMETHAFGRAPLPELEIGAEPVRAVETHDLDNPTISVAQIREWLRGIPTGNDQPPRWMTASSTDATSWKCGEARDGRPKP